MKHHGFAYAASAAALSAALLAGSAGAEDVGAAASGAVAPAAAAEENGAESDVLLGSAEVVVTARHQVERAQDVPVALSVVSGSNLERTGAYTIADLQQQTQHQEYADQDGKEGQRKR